MATFGLIGKDIGYSRSPAIFAHIFAAAGVDHHYRLFPLDRVEDFLPLVQQESPAGLNVTQPYKTSIIPFLHRLDATAKGVGAVNTIAFTRTGTVGYNTDVTGFQETIHPMLPTTNGMALVLGSGGAAKAAKFALQQLHWRVLTVSRTHRGDLTYAAIDGALVAQVKLIVQATPVGSPIVPGEQVPFPFARLSSQHIWYDMVYTPEMTPSMVAAAAQGATVKNGLDMLWAQARASWKIWETVNSPKHRTL